MPETAACPQEFGFNWGNASSAVRVLCVQILNSMWRHIKPDKGKDKEEGKHKHKQKHNT